MSRIYISSSWKNGAQPLLGELLRKYGRFLGNVDTLGITSALLEFRYERIVEIEKKKQEQEDAERDAMFRNAVPPPKEFYKMMDRM